MAKQATKSVSEKPRGFSFSSKTIQILKNFAKYNEGVVIKPGSDLVTMTPQKNVFVEAKTDDVIPVQMAIYNLTEFLNSLTLFDGLQLSFDFIDNGVVLNGGNSSLTYMFADPSVIVHPEKRVGLKNPDFEFDLGWEYLSRVMEGARALSLPNIALLADSKNRLVFRALDASNSSSNHFDVVVLEKSPLESGEEFTVHFRLENMKFLELDYHVAVSFKGIATFRNEDFGVQYAVGLAPSAVPTT